MFHISQKYFFIQAQSSGNNSNNSNQPTQQQQQQQSSSSDVSSTKKPPSNAPNPMKLHWMKMQQLSGNKPEQTATVKYDFFFILHLFLSFNFRLHNQPQLQ
jgi:hypothetical protein